MKFKSKNRASYTTWRQRQLVGRAELLETRRLLATFTVAAGSDGGTSELRAAINSSYSSPAPNTIVFSSSLGGTTIAFTDVADEFAGPAALAVDGGQMLTINGATSNGEVTIGRAYASPEMRLFNVYGSNTDLILENLTLTGGVAAGFTSVGAGGGAAGMGGAIFNAAHVSLQDSTISNSQAKGAAGGTFELGSSTPFGAGGAGGGGLGSPGTFYDGGGPNNGVSAPFGTQSSGTNGGFGGGGGGGGNYTTYFAAGDGGNGGFGGGGGAAGYYEGDLSSNPNGASGGFGGGGGGTFNYMHEGPSAFGGGEGDYFVNGGDIPTNFYDVGGSGAGMGGAVFNYLGGFNAVDSTISNNSATGGPADGAGSLYSAGSSFGGAVFTYGGTVQIVQSTIADNSVVAAGSDCSGAGIYSYNGNVSVVNSTFAFDSIAGSTTNENGTAIFSNGDAGTSTVALTDTILASSGSYKALWSTTVGGGTSTIDALASLTTGSNTTVAGLTTVSAAALLLAPLGNYGGPTQTVALLPGSAAIQAGLSEGMTTDQRGVAVPTGVAPDVGAFQSQGFAISITGGTRQSTAISTAFPTALSISVTADDPGLSNLSGGIVTFSAPTSGPSATLSASRVTLTASNTAQVTATANSTAGTYDVTASADLGVADFQLTNSYISPPVVNTTVDEVNAGGGVISLRDAINAADDTSGPVTITFASSLAGQTVLLGAVGDNTFGASAFGITGNVTIDGGRLGITIARDTSAAPSRLRLFYVAPGATLTLNDLTLSGGLSNGSSGLQGAGGGAGMGGAILNAGTLNLGSDTLVGNVAQGGSGLSSAGSGVGGGLNGNQSGGGFAQGGTAGTQTSPGGTGGFGGGGGASGTGGTITENGAAGGFGGGGGRGYSAGGGTAVVGIGGVGAGNSTATLGGGGGGLGGAIFNYAGTVNLNNSTLTDNSALGGSGGVAGSGFGGAIFNLNGNILAIDTTIADNTANQGAGGVYSLGDNTITTQAGPTLPNTNPNLGILGLGDCIVAGSNNSSGTLVSDVMQVGINGGTSTSLGSYDLIQTRTGGDFSGANVITGDPVLFALGNYGGPTETMPPEGGSPAIRAGLGQTGYVVDQRGSYRQITGTDDLGAVEVAPIISAPFIYLRVDPTVSQTLDVYFNPTGSGTPAATILQPGLQSLTTNGTSSGNGKLVADFSNGRLFSSIVAFSYNGVGIGATLETIGTSSGDMINVNAGNVSVGSTTLPFDNVQNLIVEPLAGNDILQIAAGLTVYFPAAPAGGGILARTFGILQFGSGSKLVVPTAAASSDRTLLVLQGNLNLSATVTLDLGGNDADLPGGSLPSISNLVKSGYAGGLWNGAGIDSSDAAAHSSQLTALGVIQNNQGGTPIFKSNNPFDGTIPGQNDVLIKYTYYGDANLDGRVDGSDYSLIDNGYLRHLTGWYNGDFNYDGVVNASDYTLIDNAFNRQGASPAAAASHALSTAGDATQSSKSSRTATGTSHGTTASIAPADFISANNDVILQARKKRALILDFHTA